MFEWFQMIRNVRDITRLATMSDAAFKDNIDKLRAHRSIEFRALCAARWCHIAYAGEDRNAHTPEAWHLWARFEEYGKNEAFEKASLN